MKKITTLAALFVVGIGITTGCKNPVGNPQATAIGGKLVKAAMTPTIKATAGMQLAVIHVEGMT